jgi:hypothetical protein
MGTRQVIQMLNLTKRSSLLSTSPRKSNIQYPETLIKLSKRKRVNLTTQRNNIGISQKCLLERERRTLLFLEMLELACIAQVLFEIFLTELFISRIIR